MDAIIEWLRHPLFGGAPTWIVAVVIACAVAERLLAKASRPEFRSLIGVGATVIRWALTVTRVAALPVAGPLIVRVLEAIAGVDLDGDGRIADRTPPKGMPTVPPPPPAAIVLLAALALGASSCGHVGPVVQDFADCAAPEAREFADTWKGDLVDVLACTGAETVLIPPCVAAGLAKLYREHGAALVDCALIAIRDSFSAPLGAKPEEIARVNLVRARAAEAVRREQARGVRFVERAP